MSLDQKPTTKLDVLLAREAACGVVIRRGPKKHVCTIGWDRRTDTFELGQWLKGDLRGCDLSPDGRHLLYSAANYKPNTETGGSWTAISRTPYLKAIGLWSVHFLNAGDGLFIDNERFWLNARHEVSRLQQPEGLVRESEFPGHLDEEEEPRAYAEVLHRSGWRSRGWEKIKGGYLRCYDRDAGGYWTLRRLNYGTMCNLPDRSYSYTEHELIHADTGETFPKPDWEWADMDRRRLVWAAGGKLFAAHPRQDGIEDVVELHDFNDMTFEAIEAPY